MRTIRTGHLLTVLAMGISMSALAGCVDTIVHDEPSAPRNVVSHCQGSENVDASSVAAIPIPVVAFFSPHADLRNLKPEDYLNRCGPTTELANRDVVVDKSACIPASFTEILTLGIWQWCPATVTWSADVTNGPSPSQVSQAVIGLPAPQTTASYRSQTSQAQTSTAAAATSDPVQ
ncbi:MAG TPA: hypothetical protein VGI36_11675 [Candidatus Binataceae bacterium]